MTRNKTTVALDLHTEVDLLSCLLAALVNQGSAYTLAGEIGGRLSNDHPSVAPYDLLRAADGELIVAVGADEQFPGADRDDQLRETGRRGGLLQQRGARCNRDLLTEISKRA